MTGVDVEERHGKKDYGEQQHLGILHSTSPNYLTGRISMIFNRGIQGRSA